MTVRSSAGFWETSRTLAVYGTLLDAMLILVGQYDSPFVRRVAVTLHV